MWAAMLDSMIRQDYAKLAGFPKLATSDSVDKRKLHKVSFWCFFLTV